MDAASPTLSLVDWSSGLGRARLALVCIPWAGGGAAPFRFWGEAFGDDVAVYGVRLPGRESRHTEAPMRSLDAIVADLVGELASLPHERVAFFGHCSGALIAFELTRALRTAPTKDVTHLFAASQLPPRAVAALPADVLRRNEQVVVSNLGAMLDPELLEVLEAIVAADMEAVAAYSYEAAPILHVPITVFVGSEDLSMRAVDVVGWGDETSGDLEVHEVAGADHLFSRGAWQALAQEIRVRLAEAEITGSPRRGARQGI
jgi:surfactin synthase thioesterase subunit